MTPVRRFVYLSWIIFFIYFFIKIYIRSYFDFLAFELTRLEEKTHELRRQNERLENAIYKESSLHYVEEKARELQYVPVEEYIYLK